MFNRSRLVRRYGAIFLTLLAGFAVCLSARPLLAETNAARSTILLLVGAPGDEEFGPAFRRWTEQWQASAKRADARAVVVGLATNSPVSDREHVQHALAEEAKEGPGELWVILIGHGTFDGKEPKFNLRGADFTATELAEWLRPFRRPIAVINTTSASAPFLQRLSGTNRVVITATRSGSEVNYARFGQYLAESIAESSADLDKDGQTSLLEAFLMAALRVKEFYDLEGRLLTEHALVDDNGDGLGTPPDWFRGIRAVKSARDGAPLDGMRAHQFHLVRSEAEMKLPAEVRARRDALEMAIVKLRSAKATFSEAEYYQKLEAALLELARLYQAAEK
jgi:hypothetical protein